MKRIRRRIIGGQYKSAKSRGSYAIDLNGQWQLSTTAPNPDPTMYEGVYESFKNRGKNYSADLMYIDIDGLTEFSFYVRSYAETTYDFVVVSNLDCSLTSGTTSGTNVKLTTSGKQNSGTSISDYTLVEFPNIDGGAHRITVMYRKDSTQSKNDDRGYVLIPKLENNEPLPEAHSYLTVTYQPSSTGDTVLYDDTEFDTTQLVSMEIDGLNYPKFPGKYSFADTSVTHTVRYGFHENLTNCSKLFSYARDIVSVDASEWDSSKVTDMSYMFEYAGTNHAGITLNPSDWNVSNVTDMSYMFTYTQLGAVDFSSWGPQVTKVTNMTEMFYYAKNASVILGDWDCSSVTHIAYLFSNSQVTSLDLSKWSMPNVTSMRNVFYNCSTLSSLNISGWNTSNVTDMAYMFCGCKALSTIVGIDTWDVSNVSNMNYTFSYCTSFNDTTLELFSNWDTHNLVEMCGTFEGASAITTTTALSTWDVSNVTNMTNLFKSCSGLSEVNALSNWDTNNVTNMSNMFLNCESLRVCPELKTSGVTDMSYMFRNSNIITFGMVKLQNYDFSNVTNFSGMFQGCSGITSINSLTDINTSSAIDMGEMFADCTQLSLIGNVLNWDISNVTGMYKMFANCPALRRVTELQLFNTSNVSNMGHMFKGCSALTSLSGLENWNTEKVTSMSYMFQGCSALTSLNGLENWNVENVSRLEYAFKNCTNLLDVSPINNWLLHKVYSISEMFSGCSKLQSISISSWDIDAEVDLYIDGIFKDCTNLTQASMELVFNRTPYREATNLFSNVTTTGTLYYPASLQTKYEQYVIPYLPSTWTAIAQ